jgi:signal transduction histidine kinase
MRALPIRLQLTLWYFVMFVTAALMLSLTSWWMLRRTIDATVHQDLQERIDDISAQLRELGPHSSPDEMQKHFDTVYRSRDDGKWLEIAAQDGHWIYRSARMVSLNSSSTSPQAQLHTGVTTELIRGTRAVRVLSMPLSLNGRTYFVATGMSMNKPYALLHDFGIWLLLLTPAVVLMAAAGGHLMSRKALAPVNRIAHEARRITERNLDVRLPVSATMDELSYLSVTLNNMLTRIDVGFRSVRDFTANASHELRTPLARILTEIEIALLKPREPLEYQETLEHLHRDATETSGLIESLLTLARAEAGTAQLRLAPVDLPNLIRDVADEWNAIASRLSIDLNMALSPSPDDKEPITILGDRLSLLRLLRIFLDNACKFTAPGGVITISVILDQATVLLAVRDTGIGISPKYHRCIFDRFYKVDGDTGKQNSGAGLGLSLAAWIADQHKTSIVLDSALGHGSSFQISLRRVGNKDSSTNCSRWDSVITKGPLPIYSDR